MLELARLWSVSAMGAPWERASLLVCVLILDRSGCGAVTVLVGVTTHWWEGLGPEVPLLCLSTGDETGTYGESQPTSRQGVSGCRAQGPELLLSYPCGWSLWAFSSSGAILEFL